MKRKNLISFLLMLILVCSLSVIAFAGWQTDATGKTTYTKNGTVLTYGPHKINKKLYFFKKSGALVKDAAVLYKGHTYVSRADGTLITSFEKYKNNYYYGTSKGYCKRKLQKVNKDYYFFASATGAAIKSQWKTIGSATYYFKSNGKAVRGTYIDLADGRYYFD